MVSTNAVKKHEHYNTVNPLSKEELINITCNIKNKNVDKEYTAKIKSSASIFSKNKIDLGTFNLIKFGNFDHAKQDAKVLDLGCGYGIIGISIKKFYPFYDVYMSDINNRAIKLSRENAKENGVDVIVKQSDLFQKFKDDKFDIIITNPPYVIGKEYIIKLIKESKEHLSKNGYIELVIKYGKGGKTLENLMLDTFGNVEAIAKKSGYRVLKSINLDM